MFFSSAYLAGRVVLPALAVLASDAQSLLAETGRALVLADVADDLFLAKNLLEGFSRFAKRPVV
jgi:hypothetical protein